METVQYIGLNLNLKQNFLCTSPNANFNSSIRKIIISAPASESDLTIKSIKIKSTL
jgi:hypothetical protein